MGGNQLGNNPVMHWSAVLAVNQVGTNLQPDPPNFIQSIILTGLILDFWKVVLHYSTAHDFLQTRPRFGIAFSIIEESIAINRIPLITFVRPSNLIFR